MSGLDLAEFRHGCAGAAEVLWKLGRNIALRQVDEWIKVANRRAQGLWTVNMLHSEWADALRHAKCDRSQ